MYDGHMNLFNNYIVMCEHRLLYVDKNTWEISTKKRDWHEQLTVSESDNFITNVAYAYRKRLHNIVDDRRELVN